MDFSTHLHVLAVRRPAEPADRGARARVEYQRATAKRRENEKPAASPTRRLLDITA